MKFFQLFEVFLWKNWLHLRYNWVSQCVIFIGCCATLGAYLSSTHKVVVTPPHIYESQNADELAAYFPSNDDDFLYYAPANAFYNYLMEKCREELKYAPNKVKSFDNGFEMRAFAKKYCQGNCFAIEFANNVSTDDSPLNLNFSLSSNSLRVSPKQRYVNDAGINRLQEVDDYMRTGLLTLQHVIEKKFIQIHSNVDYEMEIYPMPTIGHNTIESDRLILFGSIYSILFNVLLLSTFLVPLVEEKQTGLKEFLIKATPWNFLNGVSFFSIRFVFYAIFTTFSLIWTSVDSTLASADIGPVALLFLLYMLSAMSYAYLLTAFFSKVFAAKIGGLLLLVIPFIFYLTNAVISHVSTGFFCTKAFLDAITTLQIFSNKQRHFTWSDLTINITENSFCILTIYALLIVQSIIYSLLYNYLACIFPGPGGLKRPYLFFLEYLNGKKKQRNTHTTIERGTDVIIIENLEKKFSSSNAIITIADKLSMTIKDKQITALLGHNGVGKTTTLNMIMGSVPKDGGKIIVCCERDVASYRHLIGFCPQHSVFMNYMTCRQHLEFFARLRCMEKENARKFSDSLLADLKLAEKAHVYGKHLSGGMKRRLSLGIALSGDTKVIVLDEPSSGLDVESRRELWDVLLALRKSKAILITTHHMEEAETLGDTICILSKGQLILSGSPMDLKRKCGRGYILKISSKQFMEPQTMELIREFVPEARILNIVKPTVQISLPYSARENYSAMLQKLEGQQEHLNIDAISITDTSLEDVFLNCPMGDDQVDAPVNNSSHSVTNIPYRPLEKELNASVLSHFLAIYYKKIIYLKQQWMFTLMMLLIVILSVGTTIALMVPSTKVVYEDELPLKLSGIEKGKVYILNAAAGYDNAQRIEQILSSQIELNGLEAIRMKQPEYNISRGLLELEQQNFADFLENVVGALRIDVVWNDSATLNISILHSTNIYHSSVILMNLVEDAMLKLQTGDGNYIKVHYFPLSRYTVEVSPTRLEYYAVIIPIGLFFYMFLYIALPFQENNTGFKNIQPLPRDRYWLAFITFDMLQHSIICCVVCILQLLLMPKELYSNYEQGTIILSILFYGWSYLPLLYCFANTSRSISTISTYLLFILIVSSITPLITSGSVQAMIDNEFLTVLLSVALPDFNLGHQLRIINEKFLLSQAASSSSPAFLNTNSFFMKSIFHFAVVLTIFICVLENKNNRLRLKQCWCGKAKSQIRMKQSLELLPEEDRLIKQEKTIISSIINDGRENEYPLLVNNLKKFYDDKPAVQDLYFAVEKGECFGLLGVNGAGKTTTFEMISSNIPISAGTIKVNGQDIIQNYDKYVQQIGYCPQSDCLNTFMTSYQTLKYVAQLRGLHCAHIHKEVMYWLTKLHLEKYKDVPIQFYSGGTKRKLNAAIAMICSPSVVLLDEPTTGVDPKSRRFLWSCIQEFQRSNKTIVLTSHSLDECEQLCNRVAIMVNGRLRCMDSIPNLKSKFYEGFIVNAKVRPPNEMDIELALASKFQGIELRENHAGILTFFIPNSNKMPWSAIIINLEECFKNYKDIVEDYTFNELTLEDIFLNIDKKNMDSVGD